MKTNKVPTRPDAAVPLRSDAPDMTPRRLKRMLLALAVGVVMLFGLYQVSWYFDSHHAHLREIGGRTSCLGLEGEFNEEASDAGMLTGVLRERAEEYSDAALERAIELECEWTAPWR
jgi:hypothetical protein